MTHSALSRSLSLATIGGEDESAIQSICRSIDTRAEPSIPADPGGWVQRRGASRAPAGAGGEAGYGYSAGFDLGALTLNQGLALPRIQAGLTAGVFDTAGLTAGFNRVDRNGDRLLCFKDVGALNGSAANWVYTYNIVDNNASIPGS